MAEPQTRVIGGDGTSVATYELAPGVFQYIESVLVEVDTSGSGDVQPSLTVQTADGVPIATKVQGTPIDGGGAGSATWALRLADENTGGTGTVTGSQGWYVATAQSIPSGATTNFAFSPDSGAALLDVSTPDVPTFAAAGVYVVTASMYQTSLVQHPGTLVQLALYFGGFLSNPASGLQTVPPTIGDTTPMASVTEPIVAGVGTRVQASCEHNAGLAVNYNCGLSVMKIG